MLLVLDVAKDVPVADQGQVGQAGAPIDVVPVSQLGVALLPGPPVEGHGRHPPTADLGQPRVHRVLPQLVPFGGVCHREGEGESVLGRERDKVQARGLPLAKLDGQRAIEHCAGGPADGLDALGHPKEARAGACSRAATSDAPNHQQEAFLMADSPLWQTRSIGQPMLMSTKSASIVSFSTWQHWASASGKPPHTCGRAGFQHQRGGQQQQQRCRDAGRVQKAPVSEWNGI